MYRIFPISNKGCEKVEPHKTPIVWAAALGDDSILYGDLALIKGL